VALPYASRYVSFRLKGISKSQLAEALSRLVGAQGVTDVEVHNRLRLVPNFNLAAAGEIREGCVNNPSSADWPAKQLSLEAVSIEELRKDFTPTIVAILDTGIAKDDPRFTLWQNEQEVTGNDFIDEDRNEYRDDKIGFDFVNKKAFPLDDMFGEEYRNHGTHVAGLASGIFFSTPPSEAVGAVLSAASKRVRPMILKVAWENGDVDAAAVIEAIQYAYDMGARVVNMSFSGPTYIKSIKREIARSPEILFVTAAGNGDERHVGQDLDAVDYFPAKLSRDLPNIISVAAHGEQLERPCFSNFGATTVDISAPGVQVESTIASGYLKVNGTSQAAPLVTFTAALLNSLGLTGSVRIKQRILTSVDFVPGLRGETTSEGILNVAKALSFRDDLIELGDANRTLLKGRIIDPPKQLMVGERAINFADVRKIVRFSAETGAARYRVTLLNNGKLEHVYGTLSLPKIRFLEKEKLQCIEVDLNSVRDIIPASIPPTEVGVCPS
jgi:subtilisin family serine protease